MEHLVVGKVVLGRPYRLPGEGNEQVLLLALHRHLKGAAEALEKLLKLKLDKLANP